jgi:hypothetical protein
VVLDDLYRAAESFGHQPFGEFSQLEQSKLHAVNY